MKNLQLFAISAFLFFTFSALTTKKAPVFTPGTYGVCDCNGAASGQVPMIELAINDDHTFHYVDNSDPARKLNLRGKWELKNNKILLQDYTSDFAIHHIWSVDKNQKCIQSRNKLNWRRLCLVKACGQ